MLVLKRPSDAVLHTPGKSAGGELLSTAELNLAFVAANAWLVAISCGGLIGGTRLPRRIRPQTYQLILEALLWTMTAGLVPQVGWQIVTS